MKMPAHPRFLLFLAVLFMVTLLAAAIGPSIEQALVLGFDAAALTFVASCLPLWRETAADANRDRAARDDGGRVLLLLVSVAALVAVLAALVRLVQARGSLTALDLVAVIGTLGLSWAFVNLVYAFHYDHLYYDQSDGADVGGLDFPGVQEAVFSDFCYFAFTIGMTCQTSDVAVQTTRLRRTVLMHGLLSYAFNLGVLAMVINLLAGVL